MREIVAEVAAALDEYRQKAAGSEDVELERLPQEGFSITRGGFPKVYLECRPDYAGQVLYCNISRTDREDAEMRVRAPRAEDFARRQRSGGIPPRAGALPAAGPPAVAAGRCRIERHAARLRAGDTNGRTAAVMKWPADIGR